MTELNGKVALVTGGGRGIGAATAKRLAAAGAKVAITYTSGEQPARAVVEEIEAGGGEALALRADAGDKDAIEAAVAAVVERFGRLDVLVNNAGIARMAPLTNVPDEDFERTLAVNVEGVFHTTRTAAKAMGDGGRIVNVGSVNGQRVPFPGMSVYAMSKFAVAGLTRGWARDLAEKGITVNAVQPGPVATDLNPDDGGDFAQALTAQTALGRYGRPEEIAAAVLFLASPEASYVTGTTLNVDGGMEA